jgi:hypothetical protein
MAAWPVLGAGMAEAQGTIDHMLLLVCDKCGEAISAPIGAELSQPVRHDRDIMTVTIKPKTADLIAAVATHRGRGCLAPHFTQTPVPAPKREVDPDDDGRWLIA